jgi:hypothetical protein
MELNIKIEDYLSKDEIKGIISEEVRKHVRDCIGNISVSDDKSTVLISNLAKQLAKEGVQEIIPNFKELINEHIQEEIKNLKLSDFFVQNIGWKSTGNKILNEIILNNKELIDKKIKEIFELRDF